MNQRSAVGLVLVFMTVLGPLAGSVFAQHDWGVITGSVRDIETNEPVGWAQLLLEEVNRSSFAHQNGEFVLRDIPSGTMTLKVYRIGYQPLVRRVFVNANDTLDVTLLLSVSPIVAEGIVIEGEKGEEFRTQQVLTGANLRQQLGSTIAETLKDEPGIAMRSMGPAPARPVLRGMGGERLLVLEDGGRTGDLSATSSDHAVVVEPMTAQRIEVYRGPEALLYGSNTLGGVVNVVRGYIPTSIPDQIQGTISGQAESVNKGYATSMVLEVPAGPFAIRIDGSYRQAQDMRTPVGPLANTTIKTYSPSIGVSYVRPRSTLGAAFGYYYSDYGIPGGFIGAHPSGVTVRLDRQHYEIMGSYIPQSSFIHLVEAKGTYSRYFHQEFESNGSLGVEFGVLAYHGSLIARTKQWGPFSSGAFGVWTGYRDYASNGLVFTPASTEKTLAGFIYQELNINAFTFQAGVRVDVRQISPEEKQESTIGLIRKRSFGGLSASLRGEVNLGKNFTGGISLMKSLRMPSLEELYSEGPHLAAYSYEVGDPDLNNEKGWGGEGSLKYNSSRGSAAISIYYNYLTDYIFPRNTGELNVRLLLPTFQTTGATASLYGAEFSGALRLSKHMSLKGQSSYVQGTLTDTNEPLPWIPPWSWQLGLDYQTGPFKFGVKARGTTTQSRLAAFEEGTNGYAVLDLLAQYYFPTGRFLNTLNIGLHNVTNAEYRDHLSRVKSIMPEPGINLKILYKAYF